MKPTIVTAFHDIGRGDWDITPHGIKMSAYLKRDTETYIERFRKMCTLDNHIIAFVDSDIIHRLPVQENVDYYSIEPILDFVPNKEALNIIKEIHGSSDWIQRFGKLDAPERWCSEYVWINFLKPSFILEAIREGYVKEDADELFGWLDFGYFRKDPTVKSIEIDFDEEESNKQMILYSNNLYPEDVLKAELIKTTFTGSVNIQGGHIFGTDLAFRLLTIDYWATFNSMASMGIIDDDQTFLLMFYKKMNEFVELRKNSGTNWFLWSD